MAKEEVNEMFDSLEKDIEILQKIVGFRSKILEMIDSGTIEERERIQAEYDELEKQLTIVELM